MTVITVKFKKFINYPLSPKKECVRRFSHEIPNIFVGEQTCFSRFNFFVSLYCSRTRFSCIVSLVRRKDADKIWAISTFFCHCAFSTLTRLSSMFLSPFIYCFRPSPSCFSVYDFSLIVRRTLSVWHKVFLSMVMHHAG